MKLVHCGYCYILEDLIEIQAVALLNNSEEWTDDVYSLSASVMDGVSIVHFYVYKNYNMETIYVTPLRRTLASSP